MQKVKCLTGKIYNLQKQQLAEAVLMKESKKKHKDNKVRGEHAWEKPRH